MDYDFLRIEREAQQKWKEEGTYKVTEDSSKEKCYVLDMFPYPSGAGLHVGHPLGYIASDIYARYKRHSGFNVLHPQGYDSFGLPAEQYAIQTGQHPALTTEKNIARYREQLDRIGFSYDWSREVRTSNPDYYRWTQWIFKQIFHSWYNLDTDKAEHVDTLIAKFNENGNFNVNAAIDENWWTELPIKKYGFPFGEYFEGTFTATDWQSMNAEQQQVILSYYRLTYLDDAMVNWCPALGTVLANDEIKDGLSERGGHPVVQKRMKQWMMRITAYADRLLTGLETIDWTDAIKDQQRNWIGRSEGAMVRFQLNVLPPTPSSGGEDPGWMTADPKLAKTLIQRAKEMRKAPTKAEDKLWQALRNSKLGVRFRRQHPIDRFIVDFVCLRKGLIIEVDGEIHEHQVEADEIRTTVLEQENFFQVIRFRNEEVINDLNSVISRIEAKLNDLPEVVNSSITEGSSLPAGEGQGGAIEVFTTRPDTIFGVSFMVLAPEHELVTQITSAEQKGEVEEYVRQASLKSERDRQANVKDISGVFTGAYVTHPFSGEEIPVWIADYVLAGYGTGAVMAVPAGDERDHAFARHFKSQLHIKPIFDGVDVSEEACSDKNAKLIHSSFLNGMDASKAIPTVIEQLEEKGIGKGKVNFRLRDAVFSRQRYWGEPFPVYYENDIAHITEEDVIELPPVDQYLPTEEGEPPLARAKKEDWKVFHGEHMDYNTMPGWAGSSWYYLRYMDPKNESEFCARDKSDYWGQVDLYMGGAEHATGHLLYSRFWCKILFDLGYIGFDEPFKKMINQGMIQGVSPKAVAISFCKALKTSEEISGITDSEAFAMLYSPNQSGWDSLQDYRFYISADVFEKSKLYPRLRKEDIPQDLTTDEVRDWLSDLEVSFEVRKHLERTLIENEKMRIEEEFPELRDKVAISLHYSVEETLPRNIPLDIVDTRVNENGSQEMYFDFNKNEDKLKKFLSSSEIFPNDKGEFVCISEVEKMSKSKFNVINPDELCDKYGADTLRCYEMFLGPIEQHKPWDTNGITGVHNFLRKVTRLFSELEQGESSKDNLKSIHKTIKKVTEDIERFSFNTVVSALMICVNELTEQKCRNRKVLEPLCILLSPYAPHLAEELWAKLGKSGSVTQADWPKHNEEYLTDDTFEYPVSFNGKMRFKMEFPIDLSPQEIEAEVLAAEASAKYLDGKAPKKVIVVPKRIVNVVV